MLSKSAQILSNSISISDIRAVKANRIRCYACKRVLNWEPAWEYGSGDKGDQCECGCTAITIEPRRPIGRRSRFWTAMVFELQAVMDDDFRTEDFLNAVIPFRQDVGRTSAI